MNQPSSKNPVNVISNEIGTATRSKRPLLWEGDAAEFLSKLGKRKRFDLVVTSPPYNLGKSYEVRVPIEDYLEQQKKIIGLVAERLKDGGSICWQVGNYVENGSITPLDIELHHIFADLDLKLRNRIVWRFGHGLHNRKRFSGRYEVVMWYTKGEPYKFNLDAVRVPPKYPGKKAYQGKKRGQYSSNPNGKNPEDVWDDIWNIPNVKGNHVEKTDHPCQFPVGLIERLVLALTDEGDLVFDPYIGTGTTAVASVLHNRRAWGCEIDPEYVTISQDRISAAIAGEAEFRPHNIPIYDHRQSKLSVVPER